MDGLQPYAAPSRLPSHPVPHPSSKLAKGPSDYIRALRRRVWAVLAIGVPLSILGAIWTAKQPNVYSAKAVISIMAPSFDDHLKTLISNKFGGNDSAESSKDYVQNRAAILKSRTLAERVVNDPSLVQGTAPPPEAADDLIGSLQYRPIPTTNQYTVALEGGDPERVTKQLKLLLEFFVEDASNEITSKINTSQSFAESSIETLRGELRDHKKAIEDMLTKSETIGPGGKNLKQTQFETKIGSLEHKQSRLDDLQQQSFLSQSTPSSKRSMALERRDVKIGDLEAAREELTSKLEFLQGKIRGYNSDPTVRALSSKLKGILDKIEKLQNTPLPSDEGSNLHESLLEAKRAEIARDEQHAKELLEAMRASMPEHQKYLDMLDEQRQKTEQINAMMMKLWEFKAVAQSRRVPVAVLSAPSEPTAPIRPKRALNIAAAVILSFGLGIALVCLLEHLDHSVKLPEQLATGLSLPLFGVVPRIRRTASLHRGGHLWTPGVPDSIEADAYRNLRASLLGVSDRKGPLVSLLVTSAKAGEGKSTTALNLAATCARAGERTLLMDVDLRRPSLGGVFPNDGDGEEVQLGLVDVLRGDLPWQRTVVRSDIPNLDFLPTGDTRGVPIEILGTLELRQLVLGLSNHYDRVILDGPAILGLADCRMLGRIVDAAILVVRSGSQELRPLQHAKAMLEQSHVEIAGVVFNGLNEELKNWSSYGPDTPYGYTDGYSSGRKAGAAGGLEAPKDGRAALPLAGSARN